MPVNQVDVAVVGGGIAGLSAAVAARMAGARVLLLEAAPRLGDGATGRNAGILSPGINMGLADLPPGHPDRDMWPATTRELVALVAEASQPEALLSASRTGALSLAESATAARHLAREARARTEMGLRAEMWSAAQVAAITSGRLNTASITAALWLPDEGRIHPLTLLAHYARLAREAGVLLVGNAQVLGYEGQHSHGGHTYWRLQLANDTTVAARGLVVATGPTRQPTARIFALAFDADLPESFPLFWDAAPYTYCDYRPGNGRLVTSGGRYGRAGGSPRDPNYHKRLAAAVRYWLPELAQTEPTHAWAVDLAVAAEMAPHVRTFDGIVPGYAVEGLGALGVLPGIVLGRQAGEAVAGRIQ